MNTLKEIHHKLELFLRRYYFNELLKGLLLFLCIGLLYFIGIALLEYYLWLGTTAREVLFWAFVSIEFLLFIKFIVIPLLFLLKLKKGIDYQYASKIIGSHFPQVNDKLLNFLQLSDDKSQSDLLLASIDQKGKNLQPIPFQLAINFKKNIQYLYYAAIPIVFIAVIFIIGKSNLFTDSYKRVIDYKTAYAPPAPFEFFVLNDSLRALKGKTFTLKVQTMGSLTPEDVYIHMDGKSFFMEKSSQGIYQYTFEQPGENLNFTLQANEVSSIPYQLEVIPTPSLLSFEMTLNYPNYTGKTSQTLKSTGNTSIPEGTEVGWHVETENTESVTLKLKDTLLSFEKQQQGFSLHKRLYQNTDYTLTTSNEQLKDYEKLGFQIQVIKDQYPKITVKEHIDSSAINRKIYTGQLSDDYGISKLQLHYKEVGSDSLSHINIPIKKGTVDRFAYEFPGKTALKEGAAYEFYFLLTDNDGIRNGKSSKSSWFQYRKLNKAELEQKQLEQQKNTIDQLQQTIDERENGKQQLKEINNINKQKNQLNYADKKRIENFLDRQNRQNQMMEKFQKKLQQNLSEFQKQNKEESELNNLLQERLERQQKQLKKNEALMKKLEEITDKINKEELSKRLEEMAKEQNSNSRSLEQILELTKRYYTQAKAEKIKEDFKRLGEKQLNLSKKSAKESSLKEQQGLNKEFENIQKELDQLEKENDELKNPMELGRDPSLEKQIEQHQKEASEKLSHPGSPQKAQPSQQKAGEKLKELGQKMNAQMQGASQESMAEDSRMLRQILDNLVLFSLDQEKLMNTVGDLAETEINLSVYLKKQHELKTVFEHVDDSLFALSLRQPMITERINTDVGNVLYNIDKTLEEFAENRFYQGVSYQQYTITSTNSLADYLSETLDNMQQNMSMGSGKANDFQLPDIIQSQEQLNKEMQKTIQQNKQGDSKQEEGNKGKDEKSGNSLSNEQLSEDLFEIYKQQQFLRNALEEQMDKMKNPSDKIKTEKLLKDMEEIEKNLIEEGFTNKNEQRMLQLQHQLLKLENADIEQGEKQERESESNTNEFVNPINENTPELQQYFNEVEILNRQSLPLRQIYKEKVNSYFKTDD